MRPVSQSEQAGNGPVGYDEWRTRLQVRADTVGGPLFRTDAPNLDEVYLEAMPEPHRQHHRCQACKTFLRRFGGLVTIDTRGQLASAWWDEAEAPLWYQPVARALAGVMRRAKVTGVFYDDQPVWGTPVTGVWTHLAVTPPQALVFRSGTQRPHEAMAEKAREFVTVMGALHDFPPSLVEQAVMILKADAVARAEKTLGVAQWLAELHRARAAVSGPARAHVTWRAVATAPAGFCHPRSSMIGTLLEDLAAGRPFADVQRRFEAKMHPLRYQRPQAAPTAGNIVQAERVVAQLGIASALRRRFARLDEVQTLWRPTPPAAHVPNGGVFGHLTPKGAAAPQALTLPPATMTWDKFAKSVLPEAETIAWWVVPRDNYTALVTAVDPAAPPILQWDQEDRRNPVSWYVWHSGSRAQQWGLTPGQYHPVSAITLKPSMWHGGFEHLGGGVIFLLQGAQETRFNTLALFPETLRSELHGSRATIEAYSNSKTLEGHEAASACGVLLQQGQSWQAKVRVTRQGVTQDYRLDRWD